MVHILYGFMCSPKLLLALANAMHESSFPAFSSIAPVHVENSAGGLRLHMQRLPRAQTDVELTEFRQCRPICCG